MKNKLVCIVFAAIIAFTFTALSLTGCDTGGNGGGPCANGHDYGAWSQTSPAACTTPGQQQRTCSVCGAAETRYYPAALGHNWSAYTPNGDGFETRTCIRCGHTETRPVGGVPATYELGDTGPGGGKIFYVWNITKYCNVK